MRKFVWLLSVVLLALLALFLWRELRPTATPGSPLPDIDSPAASASPTEPAAAKIEPVQDQDTASQTDVPASKNPVSRTLMPPLNDPIPTPVKVFPFGEELTRSASADEDIQVIDTMLGHFRKHFSENPIGANWEITAALTGANPKRLGYINADHPAINEQGDLCDRWDRPYIFHSDSGTEMNIISVGPDGKLDTKDDIRLYDSDVSF